MDPYAGIQFGPAAQASSSSSIWTVMDLGLGPWGGMAAWGGAGLLYHHLARPESITKMLKGTAKAARGGRGINRLISRYGGVGGGLEVSPLPTAVERRIGGPTRSHFLNLSDDIRAAAKGGKRSSKYILNEMIETVRSKGTTLARRYGGRAAATIGGAHVLGRAFMATNVITMLALGAELGRAVTQSIVDWSPSVAKPIEMDFGTGFVEESFQARTMRQQSLAAIHNSQLTVRAALGNEAVHVHQ